MSHRPVCVKCEVDLRPSMNEVNVIEYSDNGPYKIWEADEWECPECHIRVIIGFGDAPFAHHSQEDFDEVLVGVVADEKHLRHDFEDQAQRATRKFNKRVLEGTI